MSPTLIITAGEPAGIGPELCLAIAREPLPAAIVAIGDPRVLEARAAATGLAVEIVPWTPDSAPLPGHRPGTLPLYALPFPEPDCTGEPRTENAPLVIEQLRRAVALCLEGRVQGLVTGPVQKSVINDAGIAFSGHTELIAAECGAKTPVMMLAGGAMRVALATTHLPLAEVPRALTRERLRAVLRVLHHDLRVRFACPEPRIVVCGLNPHAGEGGHLGREEIETIAPVLEALRDEGFDLAGPLPADTAFTPAAGRADAVLAMFHDQGLPVIKHAAFGSAVNVTLGLPIVRTSVDHGTALDLAGTGRADAGSLRAAVELAARLAGSTDTDADGPDNEADGEPTGEPVEERER